MPDHQAYNLSAGEAQHMQIPFHAPAAHPKAPWLHGPPPLGSLACWLSPWWLLPSLSSRASPEHMWPRGTCLYVVLSVGPLQFGLSLGSIIRLKALSGQDQVEILSALPRAKGSEFSLTKHLPSCPQTVPSRNKMLSLAARGHSDLSKDPRDSQVPTRNKILPVYFRQQWTSGLFLQLTLNAMLFLQEKSVSTQGTKEQVLRL